LSSSKWKEDPWNKKSNTLKENSKLRKMIWKKSAETSTRSFLEFSKTQPVNSKLEAFQNRPSKKKPQNPSAASNMKIISRIFKLKFRSCKMPLITSTTITDNFKSKFKDTSLN
jgi:hypothetical protein